MPINNNDDDDDKKKKKKNSGSRSSHSGLMPSRNTMRASTTLRVSPWAASDARSRLLFERGLPWRVFKRSWKGGPRSPGFALVKGVVRSSQAMIPGFGTLGLTRALRTYRNRPPVSLQIEWLRWVPPTPAAQLPEGAARLRTTTCHGPIPPRSPRAKCFEGPQKPDFYVTVPENVVLGPRQWGRGEILVAKYTPSRGYSRPG